MANEKPKVIGEDLDTAKIARYLDMLPTDGECVDFHVLTKAYRGLPAEPFDRFLSLFVQAGRDINAKNNKGSSFLATILPNSGHPDYVAIAKRHGAQA